MAWPPPQIGYSEERFKELRAYVTDFLTIVAGFAAHKVTVLPVSGLKGINIVKRPTKAEAPELVAWYNGPCLMEALGTTVIG